MSSLDLRALLGALVDHEVRFVFIGGVAVAAHGYVRATQDLEVVPDPSVENARRLATALAALEATFPFATGRAVDPGSDMVHLMKRRNMTLDTSYGALDVVQDAPGRAGLHGARPGGSRQRASRRAGSDLLVGSAATDEASAWCIAGPSRS